MNETKKTGWFKIEGVDLRNSCSDFDNNFDMIAGKKTKVEDFIGGKATFKIEFIGKFDIDTFLTNPRTNCFATFEFPKGWSRKKMLENALNELGFETERHELSDWVQIKGLKK